MKSYAVPEHAFLVKIHYCCAYQGYLTAVPNEYHARRRKAFIIPPFSLKKYIFRGFHFIITIDSMVSKKICLYKLVQIFKGYIKLSYIFFDSYTYNIFIQVNELFSYKFISLYIDLEIHIIFLYLLCYMLSADILLFENG